MADIRYCTKCGKMIMAGSKKCTFCGRPVLATSQRTTSRTMHRDQLTGGTTGIDSLSDGIYSAEKLAENVSQGINQVKGYVRNRGTAPRNISDSPAADQPERPGRNIPASRDRTATAGEYGAEKWKKIKKRLRISVLLFGVIFTVSTSINNGLLPRLLGIGNQTGNDSVSVQRLTSDSMVSGEILMAPTYEGDCTLKIISAAGDNDYCVYLRYQGIALGSNRERTPKTVIGNRQTVSDLALFIKAGDSRIITVPTGSYEVYYASGQNFMGLQELFGIGTTARKAVDELNLVLYTSDTRNEVSEKIITPGTDNGSEWKDISASEFPTRR